LTLGIVDARLSHHHAVDRQPSGPGAAAPAFAADDAPPTAANEQNTTSDELVITAQKRAQDPVEVPIAVTAYSGKFLEPSASRRSTSCRPSRPASWSRTSRTTIPAS
jgi:hypothetical protein